MNKRLQALKIDTRRFSVRALICGDRNWSDRKLVRSVIDWFPKGTVVIHGATRGAGIIAGEVAHDLGFKVDAYPADWEHKGGAASPIRNRQMLKEGRPDVVYAFHDNLAASHDTAHIVSMARKAGVLAFIVSHKSGEPHAIP